MNEDKPYINDDKPYMNDDKPYMYDDNRICTMIYQICMHDTPDINDDMTHMYVYHIRVSGPLMVYVPLMVYRQIKAFSDSLVHN